MTTNFSIPILNNVEPASPMQPRDSQLLVGRSLLVFPDEWEHVCPCRFGDPRTVFTWATWSGSSYRYDIFKRSNRLPVDFSIALRWENGSGRGWLLSSNDNGSGESSLLSLIANEPSEPRRWDYCHYLWQTATANREYGKRLEWDRVTTAYVDGRLKKRRREGRVSVVIA